jgi:hypothetical protein
MRADEFEAMRRQMIAEISAHAVQLRETIGKSAFAGPVMAAMEKVPRHEFVPIEFQAYAYANTSLRQNIVLMRHKGDLTSPSVLATERGKEGVVAAAAQWRGKPPRAYSFELRQQSRITRRVIALRVSWPS